MHIQDVLDQLKDERRDDGGAAAAESIERGARREIDAAIAKHQAELAAWAQEKQDARDAAARRAAALAHETPEAVIDELKAYLARPKARPIGAHVQGGIADLQDEVARLSGVTNLFTRYLLAVERTK